VKNRFYLLIPLTALGFILFSCHGDRSVRNIHEGEIYYNIKYINNPSSLSSDFLPKELVISFRDDLVNTSLRTPLGNSGLTTVTNPAKGIYDTYFNVLAFKYYYEGTSAGIQPGFSSMRGMTFEETGKRSVICGFNCRQVKVFLPHSKTTRYIWYTNDIKVNNPNRLTPYKDINGVLMDFFYIIGQAELLFTADEVYARPIPDRNFERKKSYKKVTADYLDSLILKMISY
jgi:hypothetical protein